MNWKTKLLGTAATAMTITGIIATPAFAATTTTTVPQTSNQAIDFRSTLDTLLGEHVILAVDAMEKGYDGAADYQAVVNQLNQNTEALSNAIASIYGPAAGQQFQKMWSAHIGFFVDYVIATKKNDTVGQQKALQELSQYKVQFAQFLASADPKYLAAGQLEAGLQMHVNQLLDTFNAYVKGDYAASYDDWVQAYNHMYDTGDALGGAIIWQFPSKFGNASPNTPAANLRITLDKLLGEHAFLAMIAMQKGYDANTGHAKAADYNAAAAELGKDTEALSNAIASVYGSAAGKQFNQMWSGHITDFVNYVVATVKRDDAGKTEAQTALSQYRTDFSDFLHSANPYIDSNAVSSVLATHVNQLTDTFNNYVTGNYSDAYKVFDEAYNHMNMPGLALSTAIVQQFPSKFDDLSMPSQMPKTGAGSASMSVNEYEEAIGALLFIMMASVAGAVLVLRKTAAQH